MSFFPPHSVNPAVTSFAYAPPTISPASPKARFGPALSEWRIMLRFKILASAVPLIAAALVVCSGLLDLSLIHI